MKGAESNKILRASFLELNVIANHADNVRLLPHRFLKIAESGHERVTSFCLKKRGRGMPELWCNPTTEEEESIPGNGSAQGYNKFIRRDVAPLRLQAPAYC
jgi:hypothetical protein